MKKIPINNTNKHALVDDEDFAFLSGFVWYYHADNYAYGYKAGAARCLMHRLLMNPPEQMHVDHRNGDGLDNRKENLRICTNAQNQFNSKISKKNTSGFRGVSRTKNNKWSAQIRHQRKSIGLGTFSTPQEASKAYTDYAKKLHGEYVKG